MPPSARAPRRYSAAGEPFPEEIRQRRGPQHSAGAMPRRSIRCAATSGREMFASWRTRSSARLRSKPPTNCTSNCPRSARKPAPPPLPPDGGRCPKSAATLRFPKVSAWKTMWRASSARCCRARSIRAAGADQGRRCARHLLPLVPALDEEVWALISTCKTGWQYLPPSEIIRGDRVNCALAPCRGGTFD